MRLLVTGGGTGGHVYPALSVIEALTSDPRCETRLEDIVWVGSAGGMEERLVRRNGIRFEGVSAGALRGKDPLTATRNALSLGRGMLEARTIVRRVRPQVILATGGYVSVPVLWAARRTVPVLIYLPDVRPGLTIRYLAGLAQRVAVSFESVGQYLPRAKVGVSGYPVRRALLEADRGAARRTLGLPEDDRMLLVMGGSRGAHSINEAVRGVLADLLKTAHVFHISGVQDYATLCAARDALPPELAARYQVYDYVHGEMIDLLAAADLAVARAGAATLGEFPAVGLPAVLVPYPYAGQHQEANAAYLVERAAAVRVSDRDLATQLLPVVSGLLGDRPRLAQMSAAARALASPHAAERIAAELLALAGEGGQSSWATR